LRHAATFIDPAGTTPQSVSDILYIVEEFGQESEIQTKMKEIDVNAARKAADKYKELMDPLVYLGVLGQGKALAVQKEEEGLKEDSEKKFSV
jgi:hypothetical protein